MVQIFFDKSKFKNSATHYDVKFDPDKPKFLKRLAFNKLREQYFPNNWPAFDGRVNAYSAGDLPFGRSVSTSKQYYRKKSINLHRCLIIIILMIIYITDYTNGRGL